MRTVAIAAGLALAPALAALVTACSKSPAGPGPASSVDTISRLEIIGPNTVAPGETVQFNLIAHTAAGLKHDVTKDGAWPPFGSPFVSIVGPGLVMGRSRGESAIQAGFTTNNGRYYHAAKDVMVLPTGTFRLMGRVIEAEPPSEPVPFARVEVTSGAGAGLITSTYPDGRYSLYGVAGATTIRVTSDGYESLVSTLDVSDHQMFDIALPLPGPRVDVSGTYTLTITAADECRVGAGEGHLTEDAMVRSYTAVVTQADANLKVLLTGAAFLQFTSGAGNLLYGRVEPLRVLLTFYWDAWDFYDPDVVEQLTTTPSTYFVPQGIARLAGPADRLAGTLVGRLSVLDTPAFTAPVKSLASCYSTRHQVVLSR